MFPPRIDKESYELVRDRERLVRRHDDRLAEERLVVPVTIPCHRIWWSAAFGVNSGVARHRLDQPAPDLRIVDRKLALASDVLRVIGGDELKELEPGVDCRRHGEADTPDVVAADGVAQRCLHSVAPKRPERLPLTRDVGKVKPAFSSRLVQTWRWFVERPIGSAYRARSPVRPLRSMDASSTSGSNMLASGPTASVRSTSRSSCQAGGLRAAGGRRHPLRHPTAGQSGPARADRLPSPAPGRPTAQEADRVLRQLPLPSQGLDPDPPGGGRSNGIRANFTRASASS